MMAGGAPLRDRVAVAVCNWVLRHVATRRYRLAAEGAVRYGLAAAARDEAEGRRAPTCAR